MYKTNRKYRESENTKESNKDYMQNIWNTVIIFIGILYFICSFKAIIDERASM